jgi:hypothetical protein
MYWLNRDLSTLKSLSAQEQVGRTCGLGGDDLVVKAGLISTPASMRIYISCEVY